MELTPRRNASGREKVLVVDDSDDAQELLGATLGGAGYEVLQARNGRDALNLILDHPSPALIIVDLHMPVMTGPELIDVLQCYRRLAQIPILVVTGSEVPVAARVADAHYLTKPVGPIELLRHVAEVVKAVPSNRR